MAEVACCNSSCLFDCLQTFFFFW